MTDRNDLSHLLASAGQEHVLHFWDALDPIGQQRLTQQVEMLDLPLLKSLVQRSDLEHDWSAIAGRAKSPTAIRYDSSDNRFSRQEARDRGELALRSGNVAAVLVAGGQGTRLGFPHPKGMFPIGPISHRTLFQVLADQLRAVQRAYGPNIPLFLMTSPATHDETLCYLTGNHYLGLDPASVQVFCQGTMPAVDARTGKILLEAPDRLSLSPDGHGGTVAALARSGCLEKMASLGIEHIFYFQVDNPLVGVCDAEFIGYHILAGSEMSTQVVAKHEPDDRVGNVVEVDGRLQIIEYSDLPQEAAERRHPDGKLVMWAGNTAVHVIDRAFIQRAQSEAVLPFHRALKKVVTIDEQGVEFVPDLPNAIKFERFIFDLLPLAKNAIVMEVREEDFFAPVKNASGASKDSPDTARAAMVRQHRDLLRAAGALVGDDECVEVNPLFARDVSELRLRLASGVRIDGPTYFDAIEK